MGFRARSRGLELGLRFGVLAALGAWLSAQAGGLVARWAALLPREVEAPSFDSLPDTLGSLVQFVVGLCVLVGCGALASAWLTQNWGPRRRPSATMGEAPGWGFGLMALGAGGAAFFLFRGVVAGAARGSASSLVGLSELWSSWAVRTPLLVSMMLGVGGVVEWLWARREAHAAYQQAREREDGGAAAK